MFREKGARLMKIVLTGIAGRLGRRVVHRLAQNHDVIGIDRRPCPGLPTRAKLFQVDFRRRSAEDIFRSESIDAIVHMGVVQN